MRKSGAAAAKEIDESKAQKKTASAAEGAVLDLNSILRGKKVRVVNGEEEVADCSCDHASTHVASRACVCLLRASWMQHAIQQGQASLQRGAESHAYHSSASPHVRMHKCPVRTLGS